MSMKLQNEVLNTLCVVLLLVFTELATNSC